MHMQRRRTQYYNRIIRYVCRKRQLFQKPTLNVDARGCSAATKSKLFPRFAEHTIQKKRNKMNYTNRSHQNIRKIPLARTQKRTYKATKAQKDFHSTFRYAPVLSLPYSNRFMTERKFVQIATIIHGTKEDEMP